MRGFDREVAIAELSYRLTEVREACERQRMKLVLEREQVRLCREMRHARARLQLRKAFSKEVEAVTRPLVESALLN
jgi:hypothetical protein